MAVQTVDVGDDNDDDDDDSKNNLLEPGFQAAPTATAEGDCGAAARHDHLKVFSLSRRLSSARRGRR